MGCSNSEKSSSHYASSLIQNFESESLETGSISKENLHESNVSCSELDADSLLEYDLNENNDNSNGNDESLHEDDNNYNNLNASSIKSSIITEDKIDCSSSIPDSLNGDADCEEQSRSSDSFKSSSGYDSCNSSDKMGSETLRERLESIVETYNPLLKPRSDKSMSISEEIIPSLSKLNQNKVCKLKKPS